MHTVIVVAAGFGLLGLCTLAGWWVGGAAAAATGAMVFLPLWLVGAAINMYIGVTRAGYPVADEAPVFVVVFVIPAAMAVLVWWRLR